MRGPLRADPDRRKAALVRFGVEARVMQPVEPAVEVDRAVAFPQQPDHLQRFGEPSDRLGEVEAVRHGVLGLATAEAEDEPAPREVVDGQRALCEQ